MILLCIVAFAGFVFGCFHLLNLGAEEFSNSLLSKFKPKKLTLKAKVKTAKSGKKLKGFRQVVNEAKGILEMAGKSENFSLLCLVSFALFVAGGLIGIWTSNFLLIPVLAWGLPFLPFWYVIFTANFYKKQLNSELETALSVITTSYLRSESIITAVDENITYLNPPVADVFKAFLAQTRLINSNIKLAIGNLKGMIDNEVFREWCNAIIACQEDRSLKSTLLSIISKLSDIRVVSAELDYMLFEPLKEFITMAALLIGNIPLMYLLNRSWYATLTQTGIGKAILAVIFFVLFVSLAAAIKLSRPVEYRR